MSQIFQKPIPSDLLFNFIEPYCDKTDNNYLLFSKVAFKKMKLKENSIQNFYDSIKKYYYNSKQYYLERDKTYKNLITIIRQICKYLHVPYTSKILYFKSTYEIRYYIFNKKTLADNEASTSATTA
tara:strand:- start:198 stop:575 length:378 start_codon:yes stop_codon:yes gene_type:complete